MRETARKNVFVFEFSFRNNEIVGHEKNERISLFLSVVLIVHNVQLLMQFRNLQIDVNGDGFIDLKELRNALDICGFKMPGYKVREMIEQFSEKQNTGLSFDEFEKLCKDLRANEYGNQFKTVVSKKENLEKLGGTSEASSEGTTHSVRQEEQIAFSDWINSNLRHDNDCKHLLPIDKEGKNLYDRFSDGLLLW